MIEHSTTVKIRDGQNELKLVVTGGKVSLEAKRYAMNQRDLDGPFECTVEKFQEVIDEIQKAMPRRTVYRGTHTAPALLEEISLCADEFRSARIKAK